MKFVVLMLLSCPVSMVFAQSKAAQAAKDSEEGYIIRRDAKGNVVKVPRKQKFKFGAQDVSGASTRPQQTVISNRASAREATLIPERTSFQKEAIEASGIRERKGN